MPESNVPAPASQTAIIRASAKVPPPAPQLVEAVHALSLAASPDEVIALLKTSACHLTGGDGCSVVLRDGEWAYFAADDALGASWQGRRFPVSAYVSGWVMRRRQAAVVPDVSLDPRVPQELYQNTFVQSLTMVPIRPERPLGALGVYWRERRKATAEAARSLQPLADASALALELLKVRREAGDALHEARRVREEYLRLLRARREQPSGAVRRCVVTGRLELSGRWLEPAEYLRRRFGLAAVQSLSPEGRAAVDGARRESEPPSEAGETLRELNAAAETHPAERSTTPKA